MFRTPAVVGAGHGGRNIEVGDATQGVVVSQYFHPCRELLFRVARVARVLHDGEVALCVGHQVVVVVLVVGVKHPHVVLVEQSYRFVHCGGVVEQQAYGHRRVDVFLGRVGLHGRCFVERQHTDGESVFIDAVEGCVWKADEQGEVGSVVVAGTLIVAEVQTVDEGDGFFLAGGSRADNEGRDGDVGVLVSTADFNSVQEVIVASHLITVALRVGYCEGAASGQERQRAVGGRLRHTVVEIMLHEA